MTDYAPIPYEESSGNVFADLGLPHADTLLVKTELILRIRDELAARRWDAAHATAALDMSQSDIDRLDTSDPDDISIDTLAEMLVSLGYDVAIRVTPSASRCARFTAENAVPTPGDAMVTLKRRKW